MRRPGTSWDSKVYQQLKIVSRVTISAWNACKSGRMPIKFASKIFGIESEDHVNSIKWCIDNKKILPQDLDYAKKSGKKMEELILKKDNPFKVKFETVFDLLTDKGENNANS